MLTRDLVFLSYAREDEAFVRRIYDGLQKRGLKVWFDIESLRPGAWEPQIKKAISNSRHFMFCLSQNSLRKIGFDGSGFVDDELQWATEIAFRQPENQFTIVPVRLEDCDRGDHRLSIHHQYDLFDDSDFETALDKLALELGGQAISELRAKDDRSEGVRLVNALIGKATMAYFAAEYQLALSLSETAIEFEPDNARAWNTKGIALFELERKDEAILSFEKVFEQLPGDYGAWYNKGLALFDLDRKDEAIHAFDKAIDIFSSIAFPSEAKVGTLAGPSKDRRASEIVSKLEAELFRQIQTAEASYYDDVDTWTSQAQSVAGSYSASMSDYYDNEVLASHRGYRETENRLQAEIRALEKRRERLKEIEKILNPPSQ